MPIIPVLDDNGGLRADAGFYVLGVMFNPAVKVLPDYHIEGWEEYSRRVLKAVSKDIAALDEIPIANFLIKASLSSKHYPDYQLPPGGWTAGRMLLTIFEFNIIKFSPKVGVTRAAWFTQQIWKKAGKNRDKTWIMSAWKHFKPVAHLWMAAQLFHESGEEQKVPMKGEDLLLFLSLAENIRKWGEAFKLQGQHGYLLSANDTWETEEGLVLPPAGETIGIVPSEAKKLMEQYRHIDFV